MTDDETIVIEIPKSSAYATTEALWHMIRFKDRYNHAMSESALRDAREDICEEADIPMEEI